MHGTGFGFALDMAERQGLQGFLFFTDAAASAAFSDVGALAPYERQRINLPSVLEHFEVHVRSGRTPGGTDVGERVPSGDGAANTHRDARVVAVPRDQTIAVVDLDQRAVADLFAGKRDDTRRDCDDIRALGAREIDAFVERLVTR